MLNNFKIITPRYVSRSNEPAITYRKNKSAKSFRFNRLFVEKFNLQNHVAAIIGYDATNQQVGVEFTTSYIPGKNFKLTRDKGAVEIATATLEKQFFKGKTPIVKNFKQIKAKGRNAKDKNFVVIDLDFTK